MKINKFSQLNESNEISYNNLLGYDMSMIDYLSKSFQLWTDAEDLPPKSADEYSIDELTDVQYDYIKKFIILWDLTEEFERDYNINGTKLEQKAKKFNI